MPRNGAYLCARQSRLLRCLGANKHVRKTRCGATSMKLQRSGARDNRIWRQCATCRSNQRLPRCYWHVALRVSGLHSFGSTLHSFSSTLQMLLQSRIIRSEFQRFFNGLERETIFLLHKVRPGEFVVDVSCLRART